MSLKATYQQNIQGIAGFSTSSSYTGSARKEVDEIVSGLSSQTISISLVAAETLVYLMNASEGPVVVKANSEFGATLVTLKKNVALGWESKGYYDNLIGDIDNLYVTNQSTEDCRFRMFALIDVSP